MYPLQCYAGFFVPVKKGMYSIVHVQATVQDVSAMSRITIVDEGSAKVLPDTYDAKGGIIELKGMANALGHLESTLPAPILTRQGSNVVHADNIVGGSLKVFVR